MKRQVIVRSLALVLVVLFVGSQAAAEERERGPRHDTSGALVLPVAGMTSAGGTFSGTLTVQRFTTSSNQIFAVGIISGTVYDAAGLPVGAFLNGPRQIPVTVGKGISAGSVPASSKLRPASGVGRPALGGLILVQAQQTCGVLHLDLAATTLNALGLTITTSPITLDVSGDSGGVLGNLVCQALGLLNSVVNLTGVLNQLLGSLSGVVGGLTGGLGA